MIVELVLFKTEPGITREALIEDAKGVIPRWRGFPNLLKKHFVLGEDDTCAGIYLWKSKADALKGHDAEWIEGFKRRTGQTPEFRYFDAFMVIDNESGTVTEYPEADEA